jgi:predicted ATPase
MIGISSTFEIKNFGKIKSAYIDIKPLTVIVGENDSGKSFATKGLYSMLSVMNNDYLSSDIESFFTIVEDIVIPQLLQNLSSKNDLSDIDILTHNILELKEYIASAISIDTDTQIEILKSEKIQLLHLELLNHYELFKKRIYDRPRLLKKVQRYLLLLDNIIENLSNSIKNPLDRYGNLLSHELRTSIEQNFQVENITTLRNFFSKKDEDISFLLSDYCSFKIRGDDKVGLNLVGKGIDEIQSLNNIVYLDSPVFIKIKEALQKVGRGDRIKFYSKKNQNLKGYPRYIDDLFNSLDTRKSISNELQELCDKIEEIIGAVLDVNINKQVVFTSKEIGEPLPINLAAMGMANIGLIYLLLKKQIIDRGSFIILDEPEVHLHPNWQIKMIEVLYELSKIGINVVIATHSIDMINYIEYLTIKDSQAKDNISINLLPYDKEFRELPIDKKLNIALDTLGKPFAEIYNKSL